MRKRLSAFLLALVLGASFMMAGCVVHNTPPAAPPPGRGPAAAPPPVVKDKQWCMQQKRANLRPIPPECRKFGIVW